MARESEEYAHPELVSGGETKKHSHSSGSGAPTTNGTYTGNGAEDRAIPHGLGVAPKIVFIYLEGYHYWHRIIIGYSRVLMMHKDYSAAISVAAMDATNFHVGSAESYWYSANRDTSTYYWVAIG